MSRNLEKVKVSMGKKTTEMVSKSKAKPEVPSNREESIHHEEHEPKASKVKSAGLTHLRKTWGNFLRHSMLMERSLLLW